MKSKSIHALLGISLEKLTTLIPLLPENYKNFIQERFDSKYEKIPGIKWTSDDYVLYNSLIIKRLKKLKNRNINNGYYNRKSIIELLDVTKEELREELKRFRQDIQDFATKHFDDDFNFSISYDLWDEDDQKYYYNTFLKYIKHALNINATWTHKPLPERFGTTKEIFDQIFLLLPEKSQIIIFKYFTNEYKPKLNIEWDKQEKAYFYNYTYKRIRILLDQERKHFNRDTYADLPGRLGITLYQFKYIFRFLGPDRQKFIKERYDSEFKLNVTHTLTYDENYIIRSLILPRLKVLIKNFGFDIINEQMKAEDDQNKINTILTEMNSNIYLSYPNYKLYISALKNNSILTPEEKIQGILQTGTINKELSKNEERIVLTRKKD